MKGRNTVLGQHEFNEKFDLYLAAYRTSEVSDR